MVAIIPDVASFPTRQDTGVTSVPGAARIDRIQGPNIGSTMAKFLEGQAKKKSFEELARAKTQLQISRIEQDNAYNDDEDVDTIEERWSGKMMENLGKAATNISEGNVRQRFIEDAQVTMAQGKMAIKQFAFKKKADMWGAFATGSTDILMKGAVMDGGDVVGAYDAIESLWASGAVNGYTTHSNAEVQVRAAKYAMAEGKIKALSPQEQLDALEEPWALELPNNVRIRLRREAEDELTLGNAQAAAFYGLQEDMDEAEFDQYVYTSTQFKNDPKLKVAAQQEFARLRTNKLSAQASTSMELYNKYDVMLRDGAKDGTFTVQKFIDSNYKDWNAITPAMRNNLEALEREAINPKPRQYSNMDVYDELMRLWGSGDRENTKIYFTERSVELNNTDRKMWSKLVNDQMPKSLFDWQKLMESELMGLSRIEKSRAYSGVNRWYMDYQEENANAPPPDQLIEQRIHKAAIDIKTGPLSSRPIDAMDLDDRIDAYDYLESKEEREAFTEMMTKAEALDVQLGWLKKQDTETFNDVMTVYAETGGEIDYREFESLYADLLEKRATDAKMEKEERGRERRVNIIKRGNPEIYEAAKQSYNRKGGKDLKSQEFELLLNKFVKIQADTPTSKTEEELYRERLKEYQPLSELEERTTQ